MTDTQWLLDLVEEATPGPRKLQWSGVIGTDGTVVAKSTRAPYDSTLIALAPDLARLVCLAADPDKWDEFLARLAELKP